MKIFISVPLSRRGFLLQDKEIGSSSHTDPVPNQQ
jgi:hypothetical protein